MTMQMRRKRKFQSARYMHHGQRQWIFAKVMRLGAIEARLMDYSVLERRIVVQMSRVPGERLVGKHPALGTGYGPTTGRF